MEEDKLSPAATFFTLIKGFVCTGCLYLPKSFINGGWAFSCATMIMSGLVTTLCALKLIETRRKLGCNSYTQIGYILFGNPGRIITDITLVISQMGFCCAYVYFIKENLHSIFFHAYGVDINTKIFALIFFFVFVFLGWVRKIEVFAATHLFADIMIVLTLLTVIAYGCINIYHEGP